MRAAICLNGEPPKPELFGALEGRFVVACDGAYHWLEGKSKVDLLLGDFDSIGALPEGVETLTYPAEKDFTDGELALNVLLERGFDDFVILGGGGLRDDHFWFNLFLLLRILRAGAKGIFYTNYNDVYLFDRSFQMKTSVGNLISISPFFESVHIIRTYGLQYGLCERTLLAGESIGVSNVATKERVSVDLRDGLALVFVANL